MSTPMLRLNDGVHLCETGGRFVFLDLTADRYLGAADAQAEALRGALGDHAGNAEDAAHSLQPLVDAGVLIKSVQRGRPLATTSVMAPSSALDAADGRITTNRLVRFVSATASARGRLRRPLEEVVKHVRRLRSKGDATLDLAVAGDLVAAFRRLRPLYPIDRQCLFESLALLEFLARWRFWPRWVFGVRLDPWRAHCWVQHDSVVLGDDLEEVVQYTPIMAV